MYYIQYEIKSNGFLYYRLNIQYEVVYSHEFKSCVDYCRGLNLILKRFEKHKQLVIPL